MRPVFRPKAVSTLFLASLLLAPLAALTRPAAAEDVEPAWSVTADVPLSGTCSPQFSPALIDTHLQGENASSTERTFAHTLYTDPGGTRWALVNVGNEIVSFRRTSHVSREGNACLSQGIPATFRHSTDGPPVADFLKWPRQNPPDSI